MRKLAQKKDKPIISRRILSRVAFSASVIVVGTLFIHYLALSDDHHMSHRDQMMVCAHSPSHVLCSLSQTFSWFIFRDLVSAIQNRRLGCGLTQSGMVIVTVAISFLSQFGLIYIPFIEAVSQTEALPLDDLLPLFALASSSFALHEGRRRYERALDRSKTYEGVREELA